MTLTQQNGHSEASNSTREGIPADINIIPHLILNGVRESLQSGLHFKDVAADITQDKTFWSVAAALTANEWDLCDAGPVTTRLLATGPVEEATALRKIAGHCLDSLHDIASLRGIGASRSNPENSIRGFSRIIRSSIPVPISKPYRLCLQDSFTASAEALTPISPATLSRFSKSFGFTAQQLLQTLAQADILFYLNANSLLQGLQEDLGELRHATSRFNVRGNSQLNLQTGLLAQARTLLNGTPGSPLFSYQIQTGFDQLLSSDLPLPEWAREVLQTAYRAGRLAHEGMPSHRSLDVLWRDDLLPLDTSLQTAANVLSPGRPLHAELPSSLFHLTKDDPFANTMDLNAAALLRFLDCLEKMDLPELVARIPGVSTGQAQRIGQATSRLLAGRGFVENCC